MHLVPPLTITLADEAGEGFAILGWFGLMGLGIYAMYLALVVLVPLGIVVLFRPERGINRPLIQSLTSCAAFPPIGYGVAALTHARLDTRGPSPSWTGLCTGAAFIALPTLALMHAIPARRTTTLAVGLGVWVVMAAISGAPEPAPGSMASHWPDVMAWSLILWMVFAAFEAKSSVIKLP